MLKNIDPLLTPDLLYVLRAMGHGDEIVIVDANYPAQSAGPRVLRLDALSAPQAMDVILTVLPLDSFVPDACVRMEVVGKPSKEQPIFGEFRALIAKHEGPNFKLHKLERYKFYGRARQCFAIVATGERRLYGNIILKKGIIETS
ncbi:MAG: RbsD/FucU family protein [Roseiarcus sp.]|jgi:L-fucose mutarotase